MATSIATIIIWIGLLGGEPIRSATMIGVAKIISGSRRRAKLDMAVTAIAMSSTMPLKKANSSPLQAGHC